MPEGLEQAIDLQGMADLLAYLKPFTPPKQVAGNSPTVIEPDDAGVLMQLKWNFAVQIE